MSKPIVVTAALLSAILLSGCGGAAQATPAATCAHGKTIGMRFNADMARYVADARTNPVGADPSHVLKDLTQLGDTVTQLSREDGNPADRAHLALAKRGLHDLEVGFADVHAGNVVGFLRELEHGGEAVRSLSGSSLSICRGRLT
jgi:hypothetical protein